MARHGYKLPKDDFAAYMTGIWKRNLEWRHFGGAYTPIQHTNVIVAIEDVSSAEDVEGGIRLLKWSFGKGVRKADLRTGYTTTVIPDTDGTFIEWKQSGRSCTGTYRPDVSVAVLSFYLPGSTVTVTYRPVDANTIAVTVVEVTASNPPTVQFGNMYRMDASLYATSPVSEGEAATDDAAFDTTF